MVSRALSLFGHGQPAVATAARFVRRELDPCCWVDHASGLVEGADTLFDLVAEGFSWEQGRRLMYGTWHDEPRLTAALDLDHPAVPSVVDEVVQVLEGTYRRRFHGLFCNFYRGPDDGVAWHADRIGRQVVDPLVAILSLGGPRLFMMRPMRGDGAPGPVRTRASQRWLLHSGDVLVMGGATQHHWEHSVPKGRHAPPRISLTTRAGWQGAKDPR